MKELGGKTGVLIGLDLPSVGGELKQGSDPHIAAIVWVRGETFKAEGETADLWQPKRNENQTVFAATIHTPDRNAGPLEGAAARSCSLGSVEQSGDEGCCWLWRGLRGCEEGDCGGKCRWKKARQPWKQGDTAELHVAGGAITIASLSPQASIGSWTIEVHPSMPEALNYRVGPHPGCSFKCLMHQTAEKDPRQGSPLSAWRGGATEKDRPKRPSEGQLQEARKKTLIGPGLLRRRQSVSLHAWRHQGPRKPSSCAPFTLSSRWGRAATGKEKSCAYACRVTLVLSDSLPPCGLWPARLLCQGGGSPGKTAAAYWPTLVAIPF